MSESQEPRGAPAVPVAEGLELLKVAVEGWKKTVDVQQHFNDLELRVRNYAVTFAAAVLGLVGWALKEGIHSLLPAGLLAIGTVCWLAFYMMDRLWYHRFLDAAVEHGREVEAWLRGATGTDVFSLAGGIKERSGIPVGKERRLRSRHRIDIFYGGFILLFAALTIAFYMHATRPGGDDPSARSSPGASSSTPTNPLQLGPQGPAPAPQGASGAAGTTAPREGAAAPSSR